MIGYLLSHWGVHLASNSGFGKFTYAKNAMYYQDGSDALYLFQTIPYDHEPELIRYQFRTGQSFPSFPGMAELQ
jgi:hypothetical protein